MFEKPNCQAMDVKFVDVMVATPKTKKIPNTEKVPCHQIYPPRDSAQEADKKRKNKKKGKDQNPQTLASILMQLP
jgi:hypothetical protein